MLLQSSQTMFALGHVDGIYLQKELQLLLILGLASWKLLNQSLTIVIDNCHSTGNTAAAVW